MSKLPWELLDHIVDLLHDNYTSLRNCCLVSKSWIPRTRRYLFAEIDLPTKKRLRWWKKTFPDPSTSPAHYTKSLVVGGPKVVTAADAGAGSWIKGFSRVVRLEIAGEEPHSHEWGVAFLPLCGFSPVVKSLHVNRVTYTLRQLITLILSFPLLEDLSMIDCYHGFDEEGWISDRLAPPTAQPSTFPTFTGSMDFLLRGGMEPIVPWLLSLPSGIHFQKLTLNWFCEEDVPLTAALMEKCFRTLEYLDITDNSHAHPRPGLFDLSKSTKLKVVRLRSLGVWQITLALRTVTREHRDLQQILIDVPYRLSRILLNRDVWGGVGDDRQIIRDFILKQWLDLDRVLVHLWESLSIRTNVRWIRGEKEEAVGGNIGSLLPEMTMRGMVIVDLVQ